MRGSITLAACMVLVLALGAGPALAIDPAPPDSPGYGRVEVLRDRRAGSFDDVKRDSVQVSYVRGGVERPLSPGLALYEGDAVRTAKGVCSLVSDAGLRVEIGENSQIRLEAGVLQRLGEVIYEVPGALTVRMGAVEVVAEAARFKVTRDVPGAGQVAVLEGQVRLSTPGGDQLVEAGTLGMFDQEAVLEVRPAAQLELDNLQDWRTARFLPAATAPPSRRDHVSIRLEGGVSWFEDQAGWGRGGLEGRFRLFGPLWLATGAAFAGRRGWELADAPNVFAVPIHLGMRLSGDLPRSFFISGGADFQVIVLDQCDDLTTCARETVAWPGGRLSIGAGLFLSRRFGLDLEFSGGILRREVPPTAPGGESTAVVDPQFHLGIGFFLRL